MLRENAALFLNDNNMEWVTKRLLRDYGGEISGAFADAFVGLLQVGDYNLEGTNGCPHWIDWIEMSCSLSNLTIKSFKQIWRTLPTAGTTAP